MYNVMRQVGKGIKPLCLAEYLTIEEARADLMSRKGSGVYIQYSALAIARENGERVTPKPMRKARTPDGRLYYIRKESNGLYAVRAADTGADTGLFFPSKRKARAELARVNPAY